MSDPAASEVVHALKETSVDKGRRRVAVKCGAEIVAVKAAEALPDTVTVWHSRTTCPTCRV